MELLHRSHAPEAARDALEQARRCATEVAAGPASELGQELERVEALLAAR